MMNKIIFLLTTIIISLVVLTIYDFDVSIIEYTYFTHDEFRYYNLSKELWLAIERDGYLSTLTNYYQYTDSHHFIYYYFLASFLGYIGDNAVLYVLLKILLHMCAITLVYRWIIKVNSYDNYPLILFLLVCYAPLSLLTISIMRDSLIFLLLAAGLFAIQDKKYFTFIVIFLLTIGFRSNAALALLFYFIASNLFVFKEISFIKKSLTLVGGAIIGVIVIPIERIVKVSTFFFDTNWPFEFIRLIFSPLPWSLAPDLPIILIPWYSLSLIIVITLVLINITLILDYKNTRFKPITLPILVFLLVYSIPYILIDNLGFRQLAVILPFAFIFNVTLILQNIKEKKIVFV